MDAQEPEEEKATKKKEFRFLSRLIVRLVDQKPEKKKKQNKKNKFLFLSNSSKHRTRLSSVNNKNMY